MKKIIVYGSGCPTCKRLLEHTKQAVSELKIKARIEYVTDIVRMIEKGFMSSPVLEIDSKVIFEGKLASVKEIKKKIKELIQKQE